MMLGVATYVLMPGHPHGLLRGVPLDWLGVAALVVLGCLVFGFDRTLRAGAMNRAPTERSAVGARFIAPAQVRRATLVLLFLLAAKLVLWYLAPTFGLAASYYPRARIGGTPERSTEYRGAPYTRIEQSPGQPGFALHFFNDVERFNYYEPPDPDRNGLPFAVRWEGYLAAPSDGSYPVALTARGTAAL